MPAEKILHVHDSDLDDPRIITAGITGKNAGYELHFAGWNLETTFYEKLFSSYHWLSFPHPVLIAKRMNPAATMLWSAAGKLVGGFNKYLYPYPHYHQATEKRFKQIIESVRPDIIHAHNIIAAHYCFESGVPMILDDHEYLSLHVKALNERVKTMERIVGYRIAEKRWAEWESELATRCPVVTVSDPIADEWRCLTKNVWTIPNYPMKDDISVKQFNYSANQKEVVSVYLGADNVKSPKSIRDIRGLHEIYNDSRAGRLVRIGVKYPQTERILSIGNVFMPIAYEYMAANCHIGLLAWKKHWFHSYCCPNKLAEYAHCGLYVMLPDNMEFMRKEFAGHCYAFNSFEDMADEIAYFNTHRDELDAKRLDSYKHAKEHLTWEKHEHKLLEAYKKA